MTAPPIRSHGALDVVFRWGVVAKGVYGMGEVIVGVFLGFVSPALLQQWAMILTQQRLSQDPDDFLSLSLVHLTNGLTASTMTFAAVYLLVHGLVKIGLLVAVVTKRYRVYPFAIAILIAFIGYQSYELIVHYSLGLLVLTIFDVVIIGLTWREYRHRPVLGDQEPRAVEYESVAERVLESHPSSCVFHNRRITID
jgi:uncharacterized membrane protein